MADQLHQPAGLITQAILTHTSVRVIGICDTPAEIFHRTAWALGLPYEDMEFRYSGLNHLGWVQRVLLRGEDITPKLLADPEALLRIYSAPLFDPDMIRALGMLPSEYLFFYYARTRAFENQRAAGASRGEEIQRLNGDLYRRLRSEVAGGHPGQAIELYKSYLNQRNASYMQLESRAGSAFEEGSHDWNPFEGATGYHRIAIDVMTALCSEQPKKVVVNVRNHGAIDDLPPSEVVEVPCLINKNGAEPQQAGPLPPSVCGLTQAVKAYEHLAIRAAMEHTMELAKLASDDSADCGGMEARLRGAGRAGGERPRLSRIPEMTRWAAVIAPAALLYFLPVPGLSLEQRHLLAIFRGHHRGADRAAGGNGRERPAGHDAAGADRYAHLGACVGGIQQSRPVDDLLGVPVCARDAGDRLGAADRLRVDPLLRE